MLPALSLPRCALWSEATERHGQSVREDVDPAIELNMEEKRGLGWGTLGTSE